MLVLSRKKEEQIQIGTDITITIIEVRNHRVRIGIDAPEDLIVIRTELLESLKFQNTQQKDESNG